MQRLNTSYTRYKHGRPGHQFEARFKAKLVEEESYLLAVTRCIHLNPIKTAACRRLGKAERMRRLEDYRWSSYPGYVAKHHAQEFVCYDVLRAKAVAVELSCMPTGERARTVGLHYGGISSSAVGNIRRKVREDQFDIRSDLDHLLARIRTAHAESNATEPKV